MSWRIGICNTRLYIFKSPLFAACIKCGTHSLTWLCGTCCFICAGRVKMEKWSVVGAKRVVTNCAISHQDLHMGVCVCVWHWYTNDDDGVMYELHYGIGAEAQWRLGGWYGRIKSGVFCCTNIISSSTRTALRVGLKIPHNKEYCNGIVGGCWPWKHVNTLDGAPRQGVWETRKFKWFTYPCVRSCGSVCNLQDGPGGISQTLGWLLWRTGQCDVTIMYLFEWSTLFPSSFSSCLHGWMVVFVDDGDVIAENWYYGGLCGRGSAVDAWIHAIGGGGGRVGSTQLLMASSTGL